MPDHQPCSICSVSAVCLSITGWVDPISAGDFFLTRCVKCARTFACRYVGVPDGASFPKPVRGHRSAFQMIVRGC